MNKVKSTGFVATLMRFQDWFLERHALAALIYLLFVVPVWFQSKMAAVGLTVLSFLFYSMGRASGKEEFQPQKQYRVGRSNTSLVEEIEET